jgi:acyl-coenzyme A thioesterase PaaI-like protein
MSTVQGRLSASWKRLSRVPGGRRIFDFLLGMMVPYSGSVRPRVLELEPGRARVAIREKRRLRNHFRSIHAIALANVGELASGLAMTLALPEGTRGIPVHLEIEYLKKARGTILAEGTARPPSSVTAEVEDEARAELTDEAGDVVARVVVRWKLAPVEPVG